MNTNNSNRFDPLIQETVPIETTVTINDTEFSNSTVNIELEVHPSVKEKLEYIITHMENMESIEDYFQFYLERIGYSLICKPDRIQEYIEIDYLNITEGTYSVYHDIYIEDEIACLIENNIQEKEIAKTVITPETLKENPEGFNPLFQFYYTYPVYIHEKHRENLVKAVKKITGKKELKQYDLADYIEDTIQELINNGLTDIEYELIQEIEYQANKEEGEGL